VSEDKLHHHNVNMEDGLIFGVVTETSHSLNEGKEEASLWGYNMSALRTNMTVLQDTLLIGLVIFLAPLSVLTFHSQYLSTHPHCVPDVSNNANKTI